MCINGRCVKYDVNGKDNDLKTVNSIKINSLVQVSFAEPPSFTSSLPHSPSLPPSGLTTLFSLSPHLHPHILPLIIYLPPVHLTPPPKTLPCTHHLILPFYLFPNTLLSLLHQKPFQIHLYSSP